ncbi:hypothetical protein GC207_01500 [bacterium]|nr:hypothetical protein [bacterium]
MSGVQLSEQLLQKAGGWQAMKEARAIHADGKVLSVEWNPPRLTGEVQSGTGVIKTGLIIKDHINVENLCPCKESRQWGRICAHALALGVAVLNPPLAGSSRHEEKQTSGSDTRKLKSDPSPISEQPPLNLGPDGEPLDLALIFPPNLAQALAGGGISVFVEAVLAKRRLPLGAIDRGVEYSIDMGKRGLLDQLVVWSNGELPATLKLSCEQFTALLAMLPPDTASFGRKEDVIICDEPMTLKASAELLASGEIRLSVEVPKPLPVIIPGRTTWMLHGNEFSRLQIPGGSLALLQAPQVLKREQVPGFLQNELPVLSATGLLEANFAADDFEIVVEPPTIRLEIEGGLAKLRAKLSAIYRFESDGRATLPRSLDRRESLGSAGASPYREERISTSADDKVLPLTRGEGRGEGKSELHPWMADPNNAQRYRLRDFAAEQDALARLVRAGFEGPDAEGQLRLNGQDAVLTFFAREYPRLQSEWQVTLEERLDWSLNNNVERIEPKCEVHPTGSGEQWFDFGVQFETAGGERFSNADIQTLVRGGRSHTKLRNGKFALLDTGAVEELQEILIDTAPKQEAGGYRFRAEQAAYLNESVVQKLGWKVEAPSAWRDRVRPDTTNVQLDFGAFADVLRPYQKDGVRWLHKLRTNGFGGILADEMGLGKTLQALAHICVSVGPASSLSSAKCAAGVPPAEARNSKVSEDRQTGADGSLPAESGNSNSAKTGRMPVLPCLVVCPTSLVFNWQAEAAKFAPKLRVLVLQGPNRHAQFPKIAEHDLIITSYALIRRDAEAYRAIEFDTVILDEAQHIKNRQSQNAQAVKSIRSRHRLVLTGTPMENSVLDLWSIFDFLMPGYLGSANDFRERYELPLSKGRDPVLQDRLSRRVRPFLQRRLKRDVAKDLPDKLEQISFCELTSDQRAVYQQVLEAGRNEVLDAVGKQGFAKSRMVIFTALLRLRQICCDLRLLQLDAEKIKEPSGKLDLFGELLEEIIDGGHRALVFSQFTSMLDLLADRLAAESIEHCRLDGSTKNRGDVVRTFQSGRAPVFLISLKAGGVGLNLTAADTVVHFDPWWNPAVEDQATDRAHRIGQRRVVTSYKLITRDTVEEKILKLQQKKRDAIKAVFGDETALTEALTWEEVQELFG